MKEVIARSLTLRKRNRMIISVKQGLNLIMKEVSKVVERGTTAKSVEEVDKVAKVEEIIVRNRITTIKIIDNIETKSTENVGAIVDMTTAEVKNGNTNPKTPTMVATAIVIGITNDLQNTKRRTP